MVNYKKSASAILLGAAAAVNAQSSSTIVIDPAPTTTVVPVGGAGPDTTTVTRTSTTVQSTSALSSTSSVGGGATIAPVVTGVATTAGGIAISIGIDFVYTTTILSLCPTGLVPVPYTLTQHCPYGPCHQPDIPYGWQVKTKDCNVCGPQTSKVVVTECPYATPGPQPDCYDCHKDVIVYPQPPKCNTCKPDIVTYTHVYPQPSPYPPTCYGDNCKQTPPPVCTGDNCKPNTPACYGDNCKPVPPPTCQGGKCDVKTVTVPCTTCKSVPPVTSQVIESCKTNCVSTVTVTSSCPTYPPVSVKTITAGCPGPYCPQTVTQSVPCPTCPPPKQPSTVIVPPPSTYVVPPPSTYAVPPPPKTTSYVCPGSPNCPPVSPPAKPYGNTTYPSPPVYTGAGMKTTASGAFALAIAGVAAVLL